MEKIEVPDGSFTRPPSPWNVNLLTDVKVALGITADVPLEKLVIELLPQRLPRFYVVGQIRAIPGAAVVKCLSVSVNDRAEVVAIEEGDA